jgi:exosortase A
MAEIWARSGTFAHGFVVPPISMWLIWLAWPRLRTLVPQPSALWLIPMAATGALWLAGELASINSITQFALVALLILTVPAVAGTRVARECAFPLGFLLFAVPIGEFLLPQLMQWTADFTVLALRLTGVPVYREGMQIVIPSGTWSIVEACSGVRYLIASLVVGTLYAYLNYRTLRKRLLFIGVAILIPIVANWIRAYMIVMIGHLSNNRLAVGVDHLIYGWLFFGLVVLIMFSVGARWRDPPTPAMAIPDVADAAMRVPSPLAFWRVAGLVAVITASWPLAHGAIERSDAAAPARLMPLSAIEGWTEGDGGLTRWSPSFLPPAALLHRNFRNGGRAVGLYVGYYRGQDHDRKLVSSTNTLVPSMGWEWVKTAERPRELSIGDQAVTARVEELRDASGQRIVAARWYWIDGHVTANDYRAKAHATLARLSGRGDDGAVVIVYALNERDGRADEAIASFVRDAGPAIERMLALTRDAR